MLTLTIYGSSSKGNCYLLSSDTTTIMLDCGVIHTPRIPYDKLDGVVLTHKHGDHIGGIKYIRLYYHNKYYSHKEVLDLLPALDNQKEEIEPNKKFNIGDFTLVPFELMHDVTCYGYLIKDNISGHKLVYITDTGMVNHRFKDVDTFLVESNCDEELLTYEDYKEVRLYETHLSMQQTTNFLLDNVNYNTKKVILCHISHSEENYLKHKEYVEKELNNKDIEVIALDPNMKAFETKTIILKEDLGGFSFD